MTDLIYNYKNLILLYIYIHIFEKHNCIISLETKTNFLVTQAFISLLFLPKKVGIRWNANALCLSGSHKRKAIN